MSRIYFKPFTFKRCISFVFLGLGCFIFNNNAHSQEPDKIIGHYYVAKDTTNMKYSDEIQWEVTSVSEWSKFMASLKKMPKDVEKNNPMGLRQPEIIHFNVANADKKSGHDIFISKAGIQQFSRMPMDIYYKSSPTFREFLETELSMNPGYDSALDQVDVNTPGIVVIFRGSSQLKNPYWIIRLNEERVLQRYKTYIKSLELSVSGIDKQWVIDDGLYESSNTFLMYLNYPNAPQQILVIGTDDSVRGTKIQQQYYYYKDELGFFSMFKRQAEDNLLASKRIEEAPETRRKREAARGALF